MRSMSIRALAMALLLVAIGRPARAVIVVTSPADGSQPYTVTQIYTTDSAYLTSNYNQSGSQYEGEFTSSQTGGVGGATIIGPHTILTATHLDSSFSPAGFQFNGTTYQTTSFADVGNGMTLWNVNGTFNSYAPIYQNNSNFNSLAGKAISDFGYGSTPDLNNPVVVTPGGAPQGYVWGGGSGNRLSWGASKADNYFANNGGDVYGTTLLGSAFTPPLGVTVTNASGTVHMASTVAQNDSGAGVFTNVNGTWELVGVNLGVDGPYSYSSTGSSPFYASVFDQTGLFTQNSSGAWVPATPDDPAVLPNNPQFWYADAITPTVFTAIQAAVPEPATLPLLATGLGLFALARRRRKRPPRP